jgi:hypothetical protein
MIRILLVLNLICLPVSSALSTNVYDFLAIPVGARPVGMGSAFTALANDPSGLYWNPAGGVNGTVREVLLEYNHYIVGVKRGYLGYLHPLSSRSSFGADINHLSVGKIAKTDIGGDELGTFSPLCMAASVTYSTVMMDKPAVMVGGAFKWIYQSIDEYSSNGVAIDLGVLYVPGPEGLTLGFCAQNIGTQVTKFREEKEPLPLNLATGASYSLADEQLILAVDLKKQSDHSLIFAVGSEWSATKNVAFRLGYNGLGSDWKSGSELDVLGGWSFGLGVTWKRLKVDLSTSPMVELGSPLWISTSYTL